MVTIFGRTEGEVPIIYRADRANAVAADGSNSFYVTGEFTGMATFDSLSVTSTGPNASISFSQSMTLMVLSNGFTMPAALMLILVTR